MGVGRHHAIIGDGAVAAAFLASSGAQAGDQLTLIGPRVSRFGAGRFYAGQDPRQPWCMAYLLDRPNAEMAQDFADWLAEQWSELGPEIAACQPQHLQRWSAALAAGDFGGFSAPRAVNGRFLAARSEMAMARLFDLGVKVRLVPGIATDLARDGDRFRITLAGGEVIVADRVDVATGGPGNRRFGADAGPTAFTTLHGNEEAIAAVLKPEWEVTCVGGSAEVLDVMHFLRGTVPGRELRLSVITSAPAPQLEADPEYRRLRAAGRITEIRGEPTWVYAEAPEKVRIRLLRADGRSEEMTAPLVINTAGPGDQLILDLLVSGMVAKGWLPLDTARTGVTVQPGFATGIPGVRYASDAVTRLGEQPIPWDGLPFDPLVRTFGEVAVPTA
jgi:hypothetical protein